MYQKHFPLIYWYRITAFVMNTEITALVFFGVLRRDYFGKNFLRALRGKLVKYVFFSHYHKLNQVVIVDEAKHKN